MDQKISELDIKIAMEAADIIPVVDSNGENKAINGAQVKDFVGLEVEAELALKQDKTDSSLETTDTTVVGAINEINTELGNKADLLTTYTKTEVNNLLTNNLNGVKVKPIAIEANSQLTTPRFSNVCVIIIGRNIPAMYVGSNTGMVAILNASSIATSRVTSGDNQYVRIDNNSSVTVVGILIYD